jgi:DNA repair exonuclease SbcCD ATPase subunit
LLPIIVNKTNQILKTIFKDRLLELCFEFIDDNLVFTVIDEGNTINMEKLSGAQSFAVSLSFRLALSSIGISKFRCRQLFIDEGFCSFDQNNLLNVPTLIKNLKHLYDEIILVTHLDEIKLCADFVVNIVRKDGISQLLC